MRLEGLVLVNSGKDDDICLFFLQGVSIGKGAGFMMRDLPITGHDVPI